MKKTAREKMLEIIEKDIFTSENKIKNEEANLEHLKEEQKDLLREIHDEEASYVNPIFYIQGYE